MCLPHEAPNPICRFVALVRVIGPDSPHPLFSEGRLCMTAPSLPSIYAGTAFCNVRIEAFNWRRGVRTGQAKEPQPYMLEVGDEAELVIQPSAPLLVAPFALCRELGRVAVLAGDHCCMIGKVVAVEEGNFQEDSLDAGLCDDSLI
jgi:hypothetical protein